MTDVMAPDAADRRDLEEAFEQHRRDLTGYSYRMLGSAFEADDAVQETMVRAWRGFARYEGRAPLRSWLFRIATNVCFDMMQGRSRRAMPMDLGPASAASVVASAPDSADVAWLQPIPDSRVVPAVADPAELAAGRESIRLAFVAALQHLPSAPAGGPDPARRAGVARHRGRGAAGRHGHLRAQHAAASPGAAGRP